MPSLFSDLWRPRRPEEPALAMPPTIKSGITPFRHQVRAVNRLIANDGRLVLAHSMGTGKTATSIIGAEVLRDKGMSSGALVVVPSGLRENYVREGVEKYTDVKAQIIGTGTELRNKDYVELGKAKPNVPFTVVSYEMFRRDPVGLIQRTGANTLILDEFHKARNEGTGTFQSIAAARPHVKNFIGLTASLVNNDPSEVASLLTLSEGRRFMSPNDFKRRYTAVSGHEKGLFGGKKSQRTLRNVPDMLNRVYPGVDYASTESLGKDAIPKKKITEVQVPMSKDQYQMYRMALAQLGPIEKVVSKRDPNIDAKLTEAEKQQLFTQLINARKVSNSVGSVRSDMSPTVSAEATPKVKRLLDDTVNHLNTTPDGQVVLYSNLINGGVDVLVAGLKARGITPAVFVGKGTEIDGQSITSDVREEGVREFKAGKRRVIVLSGAGAEGLNLKDATAFYALDGHFNPERILQAEARAVRLGGLSARSPDKREVDVRRYESVVPSSGFSFKRLLGISNDRSTDQWIYDTAKRKYQLNAAFYGALAKPHKYIRKYVTNSGKTVYVYPDEG